MSEAKEPTFEAMFASIFEGYTGSYVKHVPPFVVDEAGKRKAMGPLGKGGVFIAEYKTGSKWHPAPPAGFSDGDKIPLEFSKYVEHLNGGEGLAVSPLFDVVKQKNGKNVTLKDHCMWGLIDIDVYDQETDYVSFVQRLYSFGYKFSAFASKSGGLHLFFIFAEAEPAKDVRAALNDITKMFGMHKIFSNSAGSRVEVFPQHDTRREGQHDKYVFLPFYNHNDPERAWGIAGKMYTPEGSIRNIKKALPDIERNFTSVKEIKAVTDKLPFQDAPYCIQSLLLAGVLRDGSKRHAFLFNSALYLKMKHGDGFELKHLEEINNLMAEPKPAGDVKATFNSATKKEEGYQLAGRCKVEPVCKVCDKAECQLREFGVGKKRANYTSDVELGKIVRVMAAEPYYLWEARLAGTEEWKTLRINEAEKLLSQPAVQVACVKVLNKMPPTMAAPAWEAEINRCLSMIVEVPAPKATDTTELAQLHVLMNKYLTHGKNKNNQPHTVIVKQVFKLDGYFYFQTDGLQGFLGSQGYKLGRTNLREELLKLGCMDAELEYTTPSGDTRKIECWKKAEDEHTKKLTMYYEDVTEADTLTIMANKLNKAEKLVSGEDKKVDDDRF